MVGSRGSESILVVEDEADVRSYLVETLRDLNYRVREAPDGAAALALFDSDPFRVDLLLTDIVMPGMNGRQLAGEMQDRLSQPEGAVHDRLFAATRSCIRAGSIPACRCCRSR